MEAMSFDEYPELRFGSGQKAVLSPYVAGLLTRSLDTKRKRRDIYVNDINSNESSLRLEGTKQLARLLEADPRVGDLRPVDIRVLIGFLKHHENPELQFYALFALTHVDAKGGELIKNEALPLLKGLMKSEHIHIQIQVLITLGRIAYDFPESVCDFVHYGIKVLPNIVVSNKYHDMMLRSCSTFFAIVCHRIRFLHLLPSLKLDTLFPVANLLLRYGRGYDDVQSQTIAGLSFISSSPQLKIGRKTSSIYLGLISDADPSIAVSVLKVIKDILRYGSAYQIKLMLIGGLLQRLYSLSHCKYKIVRFQVCWILALIVERSKEYIWMLDGCFRIVENEKMPSAISVIKDLSTGQEIDFADDNFFIETPEGDYILSPSLSVGSIGPFPETVSRHVTFSQLRWAAEVGTLKHFVRFVYS